VSSLPIPICSDENMSVEALPKEAGRIEEQASIPVRAGSWDRNSLLPDQDSLFRSLGNPPKKCCDLTVLTYPNAWIGFKNAELPVFLPDSRKFPAWRGVRSRLRHPPYSPSVFGDSRRITRNPRMCARFGPGCAAPTSIRIGRPSPASTYAIRRPSNSTN
jgi:hypothetical protein